MTTESAGLSCGAMNVEEDLKVETQTLIFESQVTPGAGGI